MYQYAVICELEQPLTTEFEGCAMLEFGEIATTTYIAIIDEWTCSDAKTTVCRMFEDVGGIIKTAHAYRKMPSAKIYQPRK